MKEIIHLENPEGVLKLKGNDNDSILYLNNIPIQFTFLREIGSTWRYQIAKSIKESDLIEDNSFRQFVRFGYLTSSLLSEQFAYITKILFSGRYELILDYLSYNLELVEHLADSEDYYFFDAYGGLDEVIETQSTYDEDIINEYMVSIQKGVEPIMVVITSNKFKNKFILDGHHKFIAYCRVKRNPRALIIRQLNTDTIEKDEAENIFQLSKCKNLDYKKRYLINDL